MATVAFPAGYNLDRSSSFAFDNNVQVDFLDSGEARQRIMGDTQYVTIRCSISLLTLTEKNTLKTFLQGSADDIVTWTIDGIAYSGVLIGGHDERMVGPRYTLTFVYRAEEV